MMIGSVGRLKMRADRDLTPTDPTEEGGGSGGGWTSGGAGRQHGEGRQMTR